MTDISLSRGRASVVEAGLLNTPKARGDAGPMLQAKAQEAASLLKALAHPDRLLLLCQLVAIERSVGELGGLTGIAQPSLSQQLGVLRGERLVSTRREGKHVFYRVDSPPALAVLETLHGLFCKPDVATPRAGKRRAAAVKRGRRIAA